MDLEELFKQSLSEEEQAYFEELKTFAQNNRGSTMLDGRINKTAVRHYGNYTETKVMDALADPSANETELRELARYLFNTSRIFKSIVEYLPSIAIYAPVLIPTRLGDLKSSLLKKQYETAVKYFTKLNLPHQFVKVTSTCCVEDVFYGIEFENDQTYYIKQLNPDYCRISSVEHGAYNFEFDLTFFDKLSTHEVDTTLLEEYDQLIPNFFTKAYKAYKRGGSLKLRWVELPADKSICMKWHEELEYLLPPYASIYPDVADINDYKKLSKVSEEQNNYKIIGFQIPRMENTNNAPKPDNWAIKLSTATLFFNMARNNLSDSIGLFYTPMEFKEISFNSNQTSTRNKVKEATDSLFDGLGYSKLLFNSDNATTLKYSIKIDEARLFKFYRQLETWVNRKLIYNFKGNFRCQLVDVTILSKDDVANQLLKGAQSIGAPTIPAYMSIFGFNQVDTMALCYVQNEIMDIQNNFIPPSSTYTQSGSANSTNSTSESANDSVGRPKVKDGEAQSESTIKNAEADTNEMN